MITLKKTKIILEDNEGARKYTDEEVKNIRECLYKMAEIVDTIKSKEDDTMGK